MPLILEQPLQDHHGHPLVEGLVVVAALGALDATGAAGFAGALLDGPQGGLPQLRQQLKALFGDAHAAGEGVVDEDPDKRHLSLQPPVSLNIKIGKPHFLCSFYNLFIFFASYSP